MIKQFKRITFIDWPDDKTIQKVSEERIYRIIKNLFYFKFWLNKTVYDFSITMKWKLVVKF